jgi:GWxTD domain-containing protein
LRPVLVPRFVNPFPGLILAALAFLVPPAFASDLPPLRSSGAPYFSADVAVTIDSLTHASITVTVTVPYSELSWTRQADGFAAGAGFVVQLQPAHGDRLYGDAWEQRLRVESYAMSRNNRDNLVATRVVAAPPGRYKVSIRVRDVSSEQESRADDQIVLEDLAKSTIGLADLQLGILDSLGAFVPQPARTFGYDSDRLAAHVTMFDRRAGGWPRPAPVHWRILDGEAQVHAQGDTVLQQARTTQDFVVRSGAGELFIGDYSFEVERTDGKSRYRTSRTFEVEESGPPRGKEFDVLLEALSYIASSEEIDAMRKLDPDQQAAAWERFWRRRDPTPETPRNEFQIEFFRRLHYAAQHFQGFGYGWRSDMGRVYVRYGPPDQVEQQAATSTTPQAELWFYNQPARRFVFVDREGFGRYVLLSPSME